MAKPQNVSILAKIHNARAKIMVESLSYFAGKSPEDEFDTTFDEYANPKRRHLAKMPDEELAELLATEPSASYLHHLAASILRSRESWRTPARWAVILSAISILVSLVALWRSFHFDG